MTLDARVPTAAIVTEFRASGGLGRRRQAVIVAP